ncbi:heavy metal translocating P-type ATPase [Geminicoccus harenae]|uniref:heavy metal translocating P-type ATPase n=1 Tax=Geminicoccus harenae TaxID=2498453 RepID=UPI001C93F48B|nr:heavy metal translocating P-type ATPase [Geminicoccus harenae]
MRFPAGLVDSGLVLVALAGLLGGGAAWLAGRAELAPLAWTAGTLPVLLALLWQIAVTLRRGEVGLDVVAALAMGSALLLGETLAGNVVALMHAGGQLLEQVAERRARRDLTALLGRVARTAMRHGPAGLTEVDIDMLLPGDRILVRQGEVLPVDGRVQHGSATIDTSALTGEPLPRQMDGGSEVLSGTVSMGPPFDLLVLRPASASAYAGVVRLVEAAHRARAPAARLADRWAMGFSALTVALALVAWRWSGDPVRALAVLVVATPGPLILAVPVAIISGISRAARLGVLVKGGEALEALGRARIAILDKTGTLTLGRAELAATEAAPGFDPDEILRLAASLDQASTHVLAATLLEAARARGLTLSEPEAVIEEIGAGLAGRVGGHDVVLGGDRFVRARITGMPPRPDDGDALIQVGIDGRHAGLLRLQDPLHPDAAGLLARLRKVGFTRILLVTGDRADVARAVAAGLPLDEVRAELSPADKVALVLEERRAGPVLMVGDGVNDAPALAAADVGVAMGARGGAASAESADIVVLVDRLDRLADAVEVAHGTARIALQSVVAGLGLSVAGMLVAALGYLPPVAGALFQEAIDVAVILNALRALRL